MRNINKIVVWTKKGGCGKTNISAELFFRLNSIVITNELDSMLKVIIPKGKLFILKEKQQIPEIDCNVIFDFGGYIDSRIIQAISQSDFVLIPTLPEVSDIQSAINTIEVIKKYTDTIIVIANKTEQKGDFENIKNIIKDYPVFEIKKSRALPNMYIEKKSIENMMENKPLLKYSYKTVSEQFNRLVDYILREK